MQTMILCKHIITSLLLWLLLVTTVQSQSNESDIENIVNEIENVVDDIDPEQAAQELIELAASVPKCGDCYCIPDNDTDECPGDPQSLFDLAPIPIIQVVIYPKNMADPTPTDQ